MKGDLVVQVEQRGERTAHVTLEGSLDGHTFDRFRDSMTGLFQAGTLGIVLDLTRMAYISSVGINFLVNLRVQQRKGGGEVVLAGSQPHVMKIFKMLGLLEILVLVTTPEEAWVTLKSRMGRAPAPGEEGLPLIE